MVSFKQFGEEDHLLQSVIGSILCCLLNAYIPFIFAQALYKNRMNLNSPQSIKKFGALYEGKNVGKYKENKLLWPL